MEEPGAASAHAVSFSDSIQIFPTQRIERLDRGPVQAFSARYKGNAETPHFALICQNDLVPRLAASRKFMNVDEPSAVRLVASGVTYWPPAREERYVYVYEDPLGTPLSGAIENKGMLGWKYDAMLHHVIEPFAKLLLNFRDKDIFHGAISPDNIFCQDIEQDASHVFLGECLSTPPSYLLPSLYHPVERAMADPIGRGIGSTDDDLYAFGVTVAMLMRHKSPFAKMSDRDIIQQKIETGSFALMTSGERFSGPILELLRGLLYDSASQRWTVEELMSWLDGQRHSPRQVVRPKKAARPLEINGHQYNRPIYIAQELTQSPKEPIQLIRDGDLKLWISRSLEDKKMTARFDKLMNAPGMQAAGSHADDRILAVASMAMSPESPIRYKGHSWRPEGIPYALAKIIAHGDDPHAYVELVNADLVKHWIDNQPSLVGLDVSRILAQFSEAKKFLRQTGLGYGIERCLYASCAGAPCMSPLLRGHYAVTAEDVVMALENVAAERGADKPGLPLDRHIAAFISVKNPQAINSFLSELGAKDESRKVLGNFKTLATIQKRGRLPPMPALCQWLLENLEHVTKRLHNKKIKNELTKKVSGLASKGDLSDMVGLIDSPEVWNQDYNGFEAARQEYKRIKAEAEKLEHDLLDPARYSRGMGQEVSAIVAGVISGLIIIAFAFMQLLNNATLW